jgi:hypothetical protein
MAKAPKRERRRLATAELWLQVAMTVQEWADGVSDARTGWLAFAEWDPEDPLRQLCERYQLSPSDLRKLLEAMADQLEARAVRAGYADAWVA